MVNEKMEEFGTWGTSSPTASTAPTTTSPDPFARRFAQLLDGSDKTQRQIARELGYKHPNILSMFKTGVSRVPLDKVEAIAFILGADERELVRLWLASYLPVVKDMLERSLGAPASSAERSWIDGLRRIFGDQMPPFDADAEAVLHLLAKRRDVAAPDAKGAPVPGDSPVRR